MSDQRLFRSKFKPTPVTRAIPEPGNDLESLRATVEALREVVETLSRQRGNVGDSAVTVDDLYDNIDEL